MFHRYHEAEYVAEYELFITQDAGKYLSFKELVTMGGLFNILPKLDNEAYMGQLWHRFQQLRHDWYDGEEKAVTDFGGDVKATQAGNMLW
jgi:hypothetical protein